MIMMYGWIVICLICTAKSIYELFEERNQEELEDNTKVLNLILKTNINKNQLRVLTIIVSIACLPISPIVTISSDYLK